jgi:hypothetical protein
MIGADYWTTGITVGWTDGDSGRMWHVELSFMDDGFANDDPKRGRISTQGTLRSRYYVDSVPGRSGLRSALDALIQDAARLEIDFRDTGAGIWLYDEAGDASSQPQDIQDEMVRQAERLGWQTFARRHADAGVVAAEAVE